LPGNPRHLDDGPTCSSQFLRSRQGPLIAEFATLLRDTSPRFTSDRDAERRNRRVRRRGRATVASARSSEPVVHRSRWRERRWLSTGHRSRDVVHGDSVARIQFLPGTRSRGEAPWHTTSTNRARQSRQGDLPSRSSFSVSVQRRCATSSLWCASRRASPTGTARGQRSVSTMSLPTHPTVSLLDRNSANKIGLALRSHWVDPRVEIRGGSDAPSAGKRRPRLGRRLSPAGRRSPLVQLALGE
jgi:hypothetical protein